MAPKRKSQSTSAADPTEGIGAGQKPVDADPEPLVGAGASVIRDPEVDEEAQGRRAEVDLADEKAAEADAGNPEDAEASAEAVDQGQVSTEDISRAERVAKEKAADLAAIESEVGREAFELGLTAAGDRGDHTRAVQVAARAAKAAFDEDAGNVARARAFAAVEALPQVDSPHGRVAEEHDPWAGERWAPHGDLNVPADSDALSTVAAEQERGLNPERDNRLAKLFREGIRISDERNDENKAAVRVRRQEKVLSGAPPRRQRIHKDDPEAAEDDA
jgi:hypothetical protein